MVLPARTGDHGQFDKITKNQSATIVNALDKSQADCVPRGDVRQSMQIR